MTIPPIPFLPLRDGASIPLLAFGTGTAWMKADSKNPYDPALIGTTKTAISMGFHHLDCAEIYNNEGEVGVAIKESGVPREKLFVTTKVAEGIKDIAAALDRSLKKLQLDYVDLYLIHGPFFAKNEEDLQQAWKGMEAVKQAGKARSIGVSNYLRQDLEATLKTAKDPPVINQLEYHPYLQRANGYVPWMQEQNIQVGAFKGLTPLARCKEGPLREPLERMALAHGTNASAVLLSWHIQRNVVAVTTSRKEERLREYGEALKIKLTREELDEISRMGLTYHHRDFRAEKFDQDDRT